MEALESGSILMELKYCERCGALWLRLKDSDLLFCSACALVMAGRAPVSRFCIQPLRRSQADRRAQAAFWSEGGNA